MPDGTRPAEEEGPTPSSPAATGDPAQDDREIPLDGSPMPVLHLDGFDGPMDLLLDLAERQRIDLGRMSVLVLVEQFVAAWERLVDRVGLEQRADWLVMAIRLVLLRARLLFPESPQAAAEAARDASAELRRLSGLAFIRAAAGWLQARPQLGRDVLPRPAAPDSREGGYVALMEACLVVLRGREGQPEAAPLYRPPIPELWRVPDALARLRILLNEHPEGGDLTAFLPAIGTDDPQRPLKLRAAIASTFVAGLELAKADVVRLNQSQAFGAMTIAPAMPG